MWDGAGRAQWVLGGTLMCPWGMRGLERFRGWCCSPERPPPALFCSPSRCSWSHRISNVGKNPGKSRAGTQPLLCKGIHCPSPRWEGGLRCPGTGPSPGRVNEPPQIPLQPPEPPRQCGGKGGLGTPDPANPIPLGTLLGALSLSEALMDVPACWECWLLALRGSDQYPSPCLLSPGLASSRSCPPSAFTLMDAVTPWHSWGFCPTSCVP